MVIVDQIEIRFKRGNMEIDKIFNDWDFDEVEEKFIKLWHKQ